MSRALPPLRALRAFDAAARHGSFAKAAHELCVTQAAVSQQVKLLEEWFGKVLFERGRNSVSLTSAGSNLLPTVIAAFSSLSEASLALRNGIEPVRVRVSARPNFAANWLIPRLPRLLARVPALEIEVVTAARPLADTFLDCDLAICRFQDAPQFTFEFLFSAELYPVASSSLLAGRVLSDPAELLDYPLIHFSGSPSDWQRWLAAAGVPPEGTERGLRFDSHALVIEAARRGLGIALVPSPFMDSGGGPYGLESPFPLRIPSNDSWYLVLPKTLRHDRVDPIRAWIMDEIHLDDHFNTHSPVEPT